MEMSQVEELRFQVAMHTKTIRQLKQSLEVYEKIEQRPGPAEPKTHDQLKKYYEHKLLNYQLKYHDMETKYQKMKERYQSSIDLLGVRYAELECTKQINVNLEDEIKYLKNEMSIRMQKTKKKVAVDKVEVDLNKSMDEMSLNSSMDVDDEPRERKYERQVDEVNNIKFKSSNQENEDDDDEEEVEEEGEDDSDWEPTRTSSSNNKRRVKTKGGTKGLEGLMKTSKCPNEVDNSLTQFYPHYAGVRIIGADAYRGCDDGCQRKNHADQCCIKKATKSWVERNLYNSLTESIDRAFVYEKYQTDIKLTGYRKYFGRKTFNKLIQKSMGWLEEGTGEPFKRATYVRLNYLGLTPQAKKDLGMKVVNERDPQQYKKRCVTGSAKKSIEKKLEYPPKKKKKPEQSLSLGDALALTPD